MRVAVSGGFDPIHPGHLIMIDEAAKLGDVIVIVNDDDFLVRKKGETFYPRIEDRIMIMQHIVGVKEVVIAIDKDDTVCRTLEMVRPDIFVNGGDRKDRSSLPIVEAEICDRIGCRMVFIESNYVGHSRQLLNAYHNKEHT